MKTKLISFSGMAVGIFAVSVVATHADTVAFNVNEAPTSTPGAIGLVGFEFTLNQNIDLTQLGFYAQSLGGGDTPHVALLNVTAGQANPPVVLYDTGNLNNIVNYPAGLVNDSMNYFSVVGGPILLMTGNTYEITAPIYFGEQFSSTAGFTYGGAIASESFLQKGGWNGWDAGNGVPSQVYNYTAQTSGSGDVSTDFQYVVATPEPATLALAGLGMAGMLIFRRRN
jgi:hypothetical protein